MEGQYAAVQYLADQTSSWIRRFAETLVDIRLRVVVNWVLFCR